jgi:hypothetical protein
MEPSVTQHSGQIIENTAARVDQRHGVRGILGLPPFIQTEPVAPMPPAGCEEDETLD